MKTDDLTVLVFKDNSAARTFRVPLSWLSKLGLISGAVASVAVLGLFLSVKYYLAARHTLRTADPGYVQDLEQEVASLRAAKAPAPAVAAPVTNATSAPNAAPVPTVTVTMTPVAAPALPVSTVAFTALPATVKALPASESSVSIADPRVSWVGRKLSVQFFIHYVKEDKGNQQGRIVLLARGGETLLAYPSGVLNTEEKSSLISPDKGEYFSVSRVREVKAEFGPMKSNGALKSVEVFLFGSDDHLLVHEMLAPGVERTSQSGETGSPDDTESPPSHEEENNTGNN